VKMKNTKSNRAPEGIHSREGWTVITVTGKAFGRFYLDNHPHGIGNRCRKGMTLIPCPWKPSGESEGLMGVLAECPLCHKKQSVKNNICKCGQDLIKAKRSKRVVYWINFRLPGGKQRRERVGKSIEKARDADGKRRVQKRENRIFEMLPEADISFNELKDWYMALPSTNKLASSDRVELALRNFCKVFGEKLVSDIIPIDLESYQEIRKKDGIKPATIDLELSCIKTMINKAFYNDKVSGHVLKKFGEIRKLNKIGENARTRTISTDEYKKILNEAKGHTRKFIIIAYNTGMRSGEIRKLRWSYIDTKNQMIRLPKEITKTSKGRSIPINHHVRKLFQELRPLKVVDEELQDIVILFRGKPLINKMGIWYSFRSVCESVGITYGRKIENGATVHDIRRSVKTGMLKAGVRRTYRDLILGHSLSGMDRHYIAPSDKDLHDAMQVYTDWLDGQLESKNVDKALTNERKAIIN
jgi:integrase